MTIASEISRLQGAKACMKAAIEGKGVTVGSNVKLDDYYCCINSIPTGGSGERKIDLLVVGGGGRTGPSTSYAGGYPNCAYGGGGAGGVVEKQNVGLGFIDSYNVVVGGGGGGYVAGRGEGPNYQPSCFGSLIAYGGGAGSAGHYCCSGKAGSSYENYGQSGASGGGGGSVGNCGCPANSSRCQGHNGADITNGYGGGGGGAGGDANGCNGGIGVCSCIEGSLKRYAGGGPGGKSKTSCVGEGGCGRDYCGGAGKGGLVVVRYKIDGSMGINCATGGNCCYTCDGYCIHMFTSSGTFNVIS